MKKGRKKSELKGYEKQIIDSLLYKPRKNHKKEKCESMRCKVDIHKNNGREIIDSFIVNTDSLNETVNSIVLTYGSDVQFKMTNLYNEKIVVDRSVYINNINKDKIDKEHYIRRMDVIKKIQKMRDEGNNLEQVYTKFSHLCARSYIDIVYKSTEEQMIQRLRDEYKNDSLGKT